MNHRQTSRFKIIVCKMSRSGKYVLAINGILLALFPGGCTQDEHQQRRVSATPTATVERPAAAAESHSPAVGSEMDQIAKGLEDGTILLSASEPELIKLRDNIANNLQNIGRLAGHKDLEVRQQNRGLAICNWDRDPQDIKTELLSRNVLVLLKKAGYRMVAISKKGCNVRQDVHIANIDDLITQ